MLKVFLFALVLVFILRKNVGYEYKQQQNSTGSRQRAARFIASWKAPSATAPSPKKQAVTTGRPCIRSASASPAANGRPLATMAVPP